MSVVRTVDEAGMDREVHPETPEQPGRAEAGDEMVSLDPKEDGEPPDPLVRLYPFS